MQRHSLLFPYHVTLPGIKKKLDSSEQLLALNFSSEACKIVNRVLGYDTSYNSGSVAEKFNGNDETDEFISYV